MTELLTRPISDTEWQGLAGALSFEDGTRPWIYVSSDVESEITVCAACEGIEIHHYSDPQNIRQESYQLAHFFTPLAARCLAEGMAQAIEQGRHPSEVAQKFGMEQVA
jgi:hypothetical protein